MSRFVSSILVCILGLGLSVSAQVTKPQTTPPDNTKVNKRDQDQSRPTAGQQKENPPDREITRQIRRSITQDKDLSTYARNVKIITQNGNVTLRGPVRSEEEKKTIEAKANEVAGAGHVKSEIQITTAKEPNKKNP
jgi:hyperosmotically inducible periplasmic protein